ncbi:PH domain-containing protein [Oryzobacter terrae]|uniref:PH domain-containing protein n=1 Tax=Oryzobacter terrae TaxID=1620385 RepID=UPI00366BCADC
MTTDRVAPHAPDAPFRPRRGRVMPLVMAVVALTVCVVSAVLLGRGREWGPADQVALVGFGAAIAAFLLRYATIRAVPDADGLTVRNLVVTRRVSWAEVADVRFDDGAPWVTLDLVDDDELAVMAIQRADGESGRAEARRLGSLVARQRAGGAASA